MSVLTAPTALPVAPDLPALLHAQRASHLADGPPSAAVRQNRVDRLLAVMLDEAENLVEALDADYGSRSRTQSYLSDVLGPLPSIAHTRKHLEAWMRPTPVSAGPLRALGGRAWVQWQPLGVVGIISPWNFPVGLALVPAAAAFAAGNRVMLKLSELVPATTEVMQRALAREFDPTELVAVTGGPEVGQAFSSLPLDHLMLTGSTATGRHVMRAAADHLVPVTLELGGKCPVVAGPGADLQELSRRVLAVKAMNAGQLCLTPDHVFVEEHREDELVAALSKRFAQMYPTLLGNQDWSSVVNGAQHARLVGLREDARAKGARVVELNPAGEDFAGQQGAHKMPLTLLLDVRDDMAVMQEEVFGPLLPVLTYRQVEEVVQHVNAGEKPLAAYWFGPEGSERELFLERTCSGGVTLDDVVLHFTVEDLPFGGVGASGTGSYHGRTGFETFSHARSVLQAPRRVWPTSLMAAPYGPLVQKGLRLAARTEARRVRKRLGR
ncbi:MAG: coniferyl aldehyde dehydrogenase [Frankiales bacterium]|nr:coniferyl aldehyde dehydrogenase [Frankiales bacterium]